MESGVEENGKLETADPRDNREEKEERHISTDLETLGVYPGCAILTIGMAEFDPFDDTVGEKAAWAISLESCVAAGLTIYIPTLVWWSKQDEEAQRAALFNRSAAPLQTVLEDVSEFLTDPGGRETMVWGNGASFDLGILAAAYLALDMEVPWNFYNERDVRTMKWLGKRLGVKHSPRSDLGHHIAEQDAEDQARWVQETIAGVRRRG